MKKTVLAALAVSTAFVAVPAMAQTVATGTVNVTGSVQAKCTVGTPISGTITLNELAISDGTVNSAFSNQTGGLSRSFTVRCTSSNVELKVSANALKNAAATGLPTGYTNTVHYKATLSANKAPTGSASTAYTTADTPPAPSTTNLGGYLANATNNVTVAVSDGATTNTGDILAAGSYAGDVTITISPV